MNTCAVALEEPVLLCGICLGRFDFDPDGVYIHAVEEHGLDLAEFYDYSGDGFAVLVEENVLRAEWGHALFNGGTVWIPVVQGHLGKILNQIYDRWKCRDIIFVDVLHPPKFRKHLHGIVQEWEAFVNDGRLAYCIQIRYAEPSDGS